MALNYLVEASWFQKHHMQNRGFQSLLSPCLGHEKASEERALGLHEGWVSGHPPLSWPRHVGEGIGKERKCSSVFRGPCRLSGGSKGLEASSAALTWYSAWRIVGS